MKGAVLQQRVDGVWTKVAGPALKAKVKLLAPASFRIAAGKLAGAVLKVPVAPVVTAPRRRPLSVSGTVTPLAPGRDGRAAARTASEAGRRVGADDDRRRGRLHLIASPSPACYRVRVAPAQGFAEGLSAQIELR